MKPQFIKLKPRLSDCLSLSFLIGSIGLVETVKAKELYFQPSINIQTEYDDNKRLRTEITGRGIGLSSYGVITKVGADIGVRSDRYNVSLKNQFILNRYKSDLDLDSEDFKLNLTSNYTISQKSQVGLNASFIYDTTLTSELDGEGAGIVQDNLQRQQWSITPTWSYSFSNTQSIQLSYMHLENNYEESEVGLFSNYTIDHWSTSFQQQWTPLFSNFLTVSAMSFKVPETVNGFVETTQDITEYSVSLGGNYQILPTLSTSFSIGSRFSHTEQTIKFVNTPIEQTVTSDVVGLIFSIGLDKTFESGNASVSFSRSTNPQGQGQLQVRDHIDAYFNHKFTQRLQLTLSGSFNDISISGAEDDRNARTFYDIKPSIKWHVDQQASLIIEYRYRTQSFKINDNEAVSNLVSLNFNYRWDRVATQRY